MTKLAANTFVSKNQFLNHIKTNCKTLNVDHLYGYMFHNYHSFKEQEVLYPELLKARDKKIINKAGISLYTNEEIEDILINYSDFDFIQIPFNLFDNASKRKELLEYAKSKNIEVHTRSVFLQGLFFMQSKLLPEKLKSLKPYLEKLDVIKGRYNLTIETLALQYVLQKEYIEHVLIGVETSEQLMNNINITLKKQKVPHDIIDSFDISEIELLNPSNWN
ncbi:aldo/keto reductase [Pseudotamlana carrageenivorans]|uniref:aldo/keto reductase n=1 Tax=Pseudotamlana carrageenivorans TaxID=2069432 RepID=UPI0024118328|nr:aldo/keto reductase [Tamlana carrageenivorans]